MSDNALPKITQANVWLYDTELSDEASVRYHEVCGVKFLPESDEPVVVDHDER
jgi:hypothetical protein